MRIARDVNDMISQVEDYFGVPARSVSIFVGTIALSGLLATGIYWGIFGFGKWQSEMTVASKLMLAAATTPIQPGQQGQSGQYVCPTHGAVGLPRFNAAGAAGCPVCGQPMQFRYFGASAAATPAAFQGG